MATTYRQVLNRVLRTLGEDEVDAVATELTDDYQKLVGSFVNQIKEEIEDAHNWRSLRTVLPVTVTNANSANISNTNERTRLVRVQRSNTGASVALVFDITNADRPALVREEDLSVLHYWQGIDPDTAAANTPAAFAIAISASDPDVLELNIYPKVSGARNFTIEVIQPQSYLEDDDLDTAIKIPARPLIMGSIFYALQERGEELGASSLYTEERALKALDEAIARDAEEQGGYELVLV